MFRDAVLAGPRLMVRAPWSFVAWVALRIVEQYVTLAILLAASFAGSVDVATVWSTLASLPFEAVLIAAMLRAQLDPQDQGVAWFRLSVVELKMAGLLVLATLVGLLVAFPVTIGVAELVFGLKRRALAQFVPMIGAAAAGLALMRFAPALAILVDVGRIDLGGAWRASRGRYVILAAILLGVAALENLLALAPLFRGAPPVFASWSAMLSPMRYLSLAWRSLLSVASLTVMTGAVATVWRASRQTLS